MLSNVTGWVVEHVAIFEHATGAVLASIAGALFATFVYWWRTGRYKTLMVRVEAARLLPHSESSLTPGPWKWVTRRLMSRTALDLLHRRSLARKLLAAATRTRPWCQLSSKDETRLLEAIADEVREAFSHGSIGWLIGDKDVTERDLVLSVFRTDKNEVLVLLFRTEDCQMSQGQWQYSPVGCCILQTYGIATGRLNGFATTITLSM